MNLRYLSQLRHLGPWSSITSLINGLLLLTDHFSLIRFPVLKRVDRPYVCHSLYLRALIALVRIIQFYVDLLAGICIFYLGFILSFE